ncbi:hypothetical protein Fmac_023130 [Flemingia macrophylla]|uniref:Uncharacterized protein n=1 Tax=Flemingia macrophylla TaxID=520843 RepID=A0ABD1LKL8_9FABA
MQRYVEDKASPHLQRFHLLCRLPRLLPRRSLRPYHRPHRVPRLLLLPHLLLNRFRAPPFPNPCPVASHRRPSTCGGIALSAPTEGPTPASARSPTPKILRSTPAICGSNELLDPAIKGIMNVLATAKEEGGRGRAAQARHGGGRWPKRSQEEGGGEREAKDDLYELDKREMMSVMSDPQTSSLTPCASSLLGYSQCDPPTATLTLRASTLLGHHLLPCAVPHRLHPPWSSSSSSRRDPSAPTLTPCASTLLGHHLLPRAPPPPPSLVFILFLAMRPTDANPAPSRLHPPRSSSFSWCRNPESLTPLASTLPKSPHLLARNPNPNPSRP